MKLVQSDKELVLSHQTQIPDTPPLLSLTLFISFFTDHCYSWFTYKDLRAGCGVAVVGNYLYAIGGFDDEAPLKQCERYSFVDDKWDEIAPLSCPRGHFFEFTFSN